MWRGCKLKIKIISKIKMICKIMELPKLMWHDMK